MINTSKPTTSIVNLTKTFSYETWDSILTTWDTETRTWDEMASKMVNTAKVSANIINTPKP